MMALSVGLATFPHSVFCLHCGISIREPTEFPGKRAQLRASGLRRHRCAHHNVDMCRTVKSVKVKTYFPSPQPD